jgi:hypothetical protein
MRIDFIKCCACDRITFAGKGRMMSTIAVRCGTVKKSWDLLLCFLPTLLSRMHVDSLKKAVKEVVATKH